MKILWKSSYPGWDGQQPGVGTGYATQSALLLPRLKALGHDLAVSCTFGQIGHMGQWQGIPVFGCSGYTKLGEDTLRGDYDTFKADLCISFCCHWVSEHPQLWQMIRALHIMNVDCTPMSLGDYAVLQGTGGTPAATSRYGAEVMRAGGKTPDRPTDLREPLDPLYLPHGLDLHTFSPVSDNERAMIRKATKVDDRFVVGMNFYNGDRLPDRKNVQRQLRGYAMFRRAHPDAFLLLHTVTRLADGWNLPAMLEYLGMTEGKDYRFSPGYELVQGLIPPWELATWYRSQDVYLGAGNEGVGLPGMEAMACGTPAILLNAQSGPELMGAAYTPFDQNMQVPSADPGPGWLVGGEAEFNEVHRADWVRASAAQVCTALEHAYDEAAKRRDLARDCAAPWDINRVVRDYWEPVLAELA